MDNCIPRAEHDEFARRLEERFKRLERRVELAEEATKRIEEMNISIKELTMSIKTMQTELAKQGATLEALEARDGEKWRGLTGYLATSAIGLVIGYIASIFKNQ